MVFDASRHVPNQERNTRTVSAVNLTSPTRVDNAHALPMVRSIMDHHAPHALPTKTTTGFIELVTQHAHLQRHTRSLDKAMVFVVHQVLNHARRSAVLRIKRKLDILENVVNQDQHSTHTETVSNPLMSLTLTSTNDNKDEIQPTLD